MLPHQFSGQATRFLKSADREIARRLLAQIDELRHNPFPHGAKRVHGYEEKLFRVRVGDYRMLYAIHDNPRSLDIVKIDKQ
jgi:mRNA interferase RelE/StbE